MGNPDANLQGTIVSLYDIGWYVYELDTLGPSVPKQFSSFFGAISTFMFGRRLSLSVIRSLLNPFQANNLGERKHLLSASPSCLWELSSKLVLSPLYK